MSLTRLSCSLLLALAGTIGPISSFAQSELAWRSIEWANPRFPFPYERGEIHRESETLFRIDETFERELKPFGGVSPQAANFWRTCVISHFTAKRGFGGWAYVDGPNVKAEPTVASAPTSTSMYFVLGNTASEVPEKFRSNFFATSSFERICGQFLKPEYFWWK